jgi:hypothetical protein
VKTHYRTPHAAARTDSSQSDGDKDYRRRNVDDDGVVALQIWIRANTPYLTIYLCLTSGFELLL